MSRLLRCDQRLAQPFLAYVLGASAIALAILLVGRTDAEEAQWIWSTEHTKDNVPTGACYFRKTFNLPGAPEKAQIMIAADDQYELYVNSRRVGNGESTKRLDAYDVGQYLGRGRNAIAVKVENARGKTAALVARVMIKPQGGDWTSYSSDATWKAHLNPFPLWNLPIFNDRLWSTAQVYGPLGGTIPWDRAEDVAENETQEHERFRISPEFIVERVLDGDSLGSLIAMTFNEFGHIIASREGGPLIIITDSDGDKKHDRVRVYCEEVKNCQGILALNGDVYVTAEGPEGVALYRLADRDRDGMLEEVETLVKFDGPMGEHGPHGLVLGPDGMIYMVVGNHAKPQATYSPKSPHRNFYEGDLVTPRYEDPGGHAQGVKAPGGAILRVDIDGGDVEIVAGGLRNAYDLAFSSNGDLFVHDSDMESDRGTSWYRPTNLYHVIPGAEFGWRSGWAKWPNYFVDGLPEVLETGRGSPTGAVFYNHVMFPKRYHDALFLADWSEGRILVVRTKRSGATFTGSSEVFLQGEPLNVTDIEVGPDGLLYFITGGRGTAGGVFRVRWRGRVPESIRNFGSGLTAVVRQPQLSAAWSRQNIAGLKKQLGDNWDRSLIGVASSDQNPPQYRTRALDLMQLYGPTPTAALLGRLAGDKNELVRAKAAQMMGTLDDEATANQLINLLDDNDRTVRRIALESIARTGHSAPVDKLVGLLASDDRYESWAARRLLERIDPSQWQQRVLTTDDQRVFIQGSLALMIADANRQNAAAVIDRTGHFMDGFISDRDFIDMMRVMQVALVRGRLAPTDVPAMRLKLAKEFPAGDATMNRELIRLLAYLQITTITDRYMAYLKSDVPDSEKLHVGLHLRYLQSGFDSTQKRELLEFYETAQKMNTGNSVPHYVRNVARDFALSLGPEDADLVLGGGAKWPSAALGALYKLPQQLDPTMISVLKNLDSQIADDTTEAGNRLRIGIVAVLARSGDAFSMAHLRVIWATQPERRQSVAMGLAQSPNGENWPLLVESLAIVEGGSAREVLAKLATVDRVSDSPEAYRQVILRGLALKEDGAPLAVNLLQYWTGQRVSAPGDPWDKALGAWQQWYAAKYPDRPAAELPVESEDANWDFDELLEYLTGEEGSQGSPESGALVFGKAQCAKCHRHGSLGDSTGPDLTSISKRFMKKEILQSIVFPSHVISDQYAAKRIITTGGRSLTGIVSPGPAGSLVVLQSNGDKVELQPDDIQESAPSKVSSMPVGLLDSLTLEEIADLFAYLTTPPKKDLARRPDDGE